MLFNSHEFIFLFLPVTLLVFFQLGRVNNKLAAGWLTAASVFFYGWLSPAYIVLLTVSFLFNYAPGLVLLRAGEAGYGIKTVVARDAGIFSCG